MQVVDHDSPWRMLLRQIASHLQQCGADASRSVVLLPYAQLLPVARRQWAATQPASLLPRFETTHNWAQRLGPFVPAAQDIGFDAAQDWLTAWQLLQDAGQKREARWLASHVREAAVQLAPVAAAMSPAERARWWPQMQPALRQGMASEVLRYETLAAMIAVAWAGSSAYATDCLFEEASPQRTDALVVLHGYQPDPLAQALLAQWQQHACGKDLVIDLPAFWHAHAIAPEKPVALQSPVQWHQAGDLEDQVARAAACVQQQVVAGRGLVALVDNDRALTRRIRAVLEGQGLTVRDETGWKLSTTRAASHVMGLLRACVPQAASDAVLDWLKLVQAVPRRADAGAHPAPAAQVQATEACLRQKVQARWPALPWWPQDATVSADWLAAVEGWRSALQAPRNLPQWLHDLRQTLQHTGQWHWLQADAAGQAVQQALHLLPGVAMRQANAAARWSLADFTHWVQQALEAGSFKPPYPLQEQVVILPLSQLLARDLAAVVIPGCDEGRLPAAPEPPGDWTRAQRQLLGLPVRTQLQQAVQAAWRHALQLPQVDVLTSQSDAQGETLLPSPLLLQSVHQAAGQARPWVAASDPRQPRPHAYQPLRMPRPVAQRLPLQAVSASAYDSLRACPYQFFGQQHLRLREVQELDATLEKRDFGNWLHRVLYLFHRENSETPPVAAPGLLAQRMDAAAAAASQQLWLDAADFVPYQAIWPRLRDGYLQWLHTHNGQFAQGEQWQQRDLRDLMAALQLDITDAPALQLQGRIDRRDRLPPTDADQGGAANAPDAAVTTPQWLLIDYKSESGQKTSARVSQADEDTQLAFYAALQAPEPVQVGYLNVGERGVTSLHPLPEVDRLRQQLLQGIAHDLQRVAHGAALPALGQGARCDWCAVRGLCRKDFWEDAA